MKASTSAALALVLVGCAHAEPRTQTPAPPPEEREVIAVAVPAHEPTDAPVVRTPPRLSRTITLGQGTNDAQYTGPTAPPPKVPEGSAQPNVIVNNTIVQQAPPVYGWGYGYGYRYGSGFGRGESFGNRGSGSWGTTGWEGSRRTAAPGATPGIGGNWAPVPSHGPAPMR